MTDLFNLDQETAVVLGGTGVLGGAMADALAAAGARVAVVGRSAERGLERVRAIEKAGGRAIFQAADALKVPATDLTMLAMKAGGKYPSLKVAGVIRGEEGVPAHGSKAPPTRFRSNTSCHPFKDSLQKSPPGGSVPSGLLPPAPLTSTLTEPHWPRMASRARTNESTFRASAA